MMTSWIQVVEKSFLCLIAGLSLRDQARSSDIQRELAVELLLLPVERSRLRLFRHRIRMPPGFFPVEILGHDQLSGDLWQRQKLAGGNVYLIRPLNTSESPRRSRTTVSS